MAGWLALTLQRRCGPLDGPRTAYRVTDHGAIELSWRGGPTAAEVADHLLRAADPDMPVTCDAQLSDSVVAAGVRVLLTALDPRPRSRSPRDPIGALPASAAPRPIMDDGHAADIVTWELPPEPGGTGMAIVTRVPTSYTDALDWTAHATFVAATGYQPPPGAHPQRHIRWARALANADVHLRFATPKLAIADADAWLSMAVGHSRGITPLCAAVAWHDRCLMRLQPGLRVDAVLATSPHMTGVASRVPALLLSALHRTLLPRDTRTATTLAASLPTDLHISCFRHGLDSERYRIQLAATIIPASQNRQTG